MLRNQIKGNLALTGFEDIFNIAEPKNGEHIQFIPLTELHTPDPHPFIVRDDEAMMELARNIREYGVREPGLARPYVDGDPSRAGGYELLCGNR